MKRILLSLFVGFVGIISFCSAGSFTYEGTLGSTNLTIPQSILDKNISIHCDFVPSSACDGQWQFKRNFTYLNGSLSSLYGYSISQSSWIFSDCGTTSSFDYDFSTYSFPASAGTVRGIVSFNFSSLWIPDGLNINYTCTFSGDNVYSAGGGSCPECPTCPEVNTGEILSGYILESEIDTNYCVGNGLCPNECGSGSDFSGDLQYSNIYINSILHPGRQNIFVDIPDYITWDYSSTGDDFNLYVGSGYDVEYIESIIDINSYRPDSKDFTDIFVGGLTLITPYIVVILFFYIVWRLLKRIFS